MSYEKRSGLHGWARKAIVSAEVAGAIVRRALTHPDVVLAALREQPGLLAGVRPDTQLAMYQQLVSRGMTRELSELAAQRETPRLARSLIADTVLASPQVPLAAE